MSASAETPPTRPGAEAAASAPPKRPTLPRRYALLIAGAAVAILLLGWLADALVGIAPGAAPDGPQAQQAGVYRVSLALDPAAPRAGDAARLIIHIADATGRPLPGADVRLALNMPAMIMSPVELPAAPEGGGGYAAQAAFPMAGTWEVAARIAPPGGAAVQARFDVRVR